MSENLITKDLLKLDPGSELIQLYELEYQKDTYVYFHAGLDDDLSLLQFRDYTTNVTVRSYTALPVQTEGFEQKSEGAIARPTVTFGVAQTVLTDAIGTIDWDTLVGLKLIRRTTLKKYLYGESGDASPPVEFPRQVWYIDRIKDRDKVHVTFEMTSPFDVSGVKVPGRNIVANRCPFIYQGASSHLPEYKRIHSGCHWHIESKYKAAYSFRTGLTGATEYTVYVNQDDEPIVPSTTSFTAYSSGAITANTFYSTSGTALRFAPNGTSSSVSVTNYWQCVTASGSPGTINDSNALVRRVRVYAAWASGTTYYGYDVDGHNNYVTHTDAVSSSPTYQKTLLWKATTASIGKTPAHSTYWERGDLCSKTMDGCKLRFGFDPVTASNAASLPKAKSSSETTLPFGGFPGAKAFS